MRIIVSALVFIFTSAALAAPAFADTAATKTACARPATANRACAQPNATEPARARPAETKPAFAMMDNTGDGSKVNLDLAVLAPTTFLRGLLAFRPSISGQYVARNGFGVYGGISMTGLTDTKDPDIADFRLSNLGLASPEVGGLFHRALSPNFDLGVRVGLTHPFGEEPDVVKALVHGVSTLIARPADIATAFPNTFWLRLGVSPTYHQGSWFVRTDLGVDVAVAKRAAAETGGGGDTGEAGEEIGDIQKGDAIEHINVGVGVRRNRFIATAEMQAAFMWKEGAIASSSTAGLSARYQGDAVSPFVLVSTPLVWFGKSSEDPEFSSIFLGGKVITVTGGLTLGF